MQNARRQLALDVLPCSDNQPGTVNSSRGAAGRSSDGADFQINEEIPPVLPTSFPPQIGGHSLRVQNAFNARNGGGAGTEEKLGFFFKNKFNTVENCQLNLILVICLSRLRNHTLTNREKNCRRGRLRPRQDNFEVVKGFRSQGVHNILYATEICNYKMNQ
jgi:hypothetical protein